MDPSSTTISIWMFRTVNDRTVGTTTTEAYPPRPPRSWPPAASPPLFLKSKTYTHPPTRTSIRPIHPTSCPTLPTHTPTSPVHALDTTRWVQTANHFGTPLKVYGRDNNRHREGRRNFVEHVDHEDPIDKSKRTRVRFNVEGPHGHGMAYAEVRGWW